jgi:protein-S-isoprenylcysteine O-methyltransferase Ste14
MNGINLLGKILLFGGFAGVVVGFIFLLSMGFPSQFKPEHWLVVVGALISFIGGLIVLNSEGSP